MMTKFFLMTAIVFGLSSCGTNENTESDKLIRVEGDKVPKAVIYKEDSKGQVSAYALYKDQYNFLTENDFSKMKDEDVEKLVTSLTENNLRTVSSEDEYNSKELSITEGQLQSIDNSKTSNYSYNSPYNYNSGFGYGYGAGGGASSPFGSVNGYVNGYGSGYSRGGGYAGGYNNGYESGHESAGEVSGGLSGGGSIGGSINLGWLNLGFNLNYKYDLGYKFGYKNNSYSVYRPSYPYGNGYSYGSRY